MDCAPESLCSTESVCLMYRIAFEVLGLESVYSRTIKDNTSVVSFHDSYAQKIKASFPMNSKLTENNTMLLSIL